MIHIFGDSHGDYNFRNIKRECINHYQMSITMHKVGRQGLNYINFNNYNINNGDIIIYQFGEIDCRCHIGKQLKLNRHLDEIVNELISNYINSIKYNIGDRNLKIIVCCIPPTMNQEKYESKHGKITHEFPFVGTDKERVFFTNYLNKELEKQCEINGFYFFNYYTDYEDIDGTLKYELTDRCVHIQHNDKILERLYKLI